MEPLENNLSPETTNNSDRLKSTHIDVIEAYLQMGGEDIILSEHQEGILDRLRFADEKIRQGQGRFKRDEIAKMIRMKYGVSRDTAFKDIVNAERVFSSSYPLNKLYEIGVRIEFLKEQIRQAATDKDRMAVAMLERTLEKYYQQYPEVRKIDTKKYIIMNVVQQFFESPQATTMSLEEAIQQAEIVEEDKDDDI